MDKYLWVGLGGFFGAVARFSVGIWIAERLGTRFPYGTFFINISGCFLIGFLMTLVARQPSIPPAFRLIFPIGFVGAYTTFSTFEYETLVNVQAGQISVGIYNVVFSLIVGFVAVWIGMILGRLITN